MYFFYQREGGEDTWLMAMSPDRDRVVNSVKPRYVSVLDLSGVPDDNDWSKVRYSGPLYFDFDAEGDLEFACEQFKTFLGKLTVELDFDVSQARLYASGSKGFHIEIPVECFMPKVPSNGTPWLPYIYREVAQSLIVDSMDMRVYTGKRGRMWRTPNVQRENGRYKVSLPLSDALDITPELYQELVSEPRLVEEPTPPSCNPKLAMLFERSREKMLVHMRGKKRRMDKANEILDPWKKAKQHPPTIEMLMRGENVREGAGFQALSMQLAIYATSVGMTLDLFLTSCQGLIDNHVSDGKRYNTERKRREELARMWRYMDENTLYEFDVGPMAGLVAKGVATPDLGVLDRVDHGDEPPPETVSQTDVEDGDAPAEPVVAMVDPHSRMRRGFFMNAEGMFRVNGDTTESICRATLRNVIAFHNVITDEFRGYEFDIVSRGRKLGRATITAQAFTSAGKLKEFFANRQLTFQGTDSDAMSLLDIMQEKAARGGKVYTYPREGFFVIDHPECPDERQPVKVYLTKTEFMSSLSETDAKFNLCYRPETALSAYNIDIHKAPKLDESMETPLRDLFRFNRPDHVADILGWMVAAHYRSLYLYLFKQFPVLQVYGTAGSGKTKTVEALTALHWFMNKPPMQSATSMSYFALEIAASTSTSAPFLIDEVKPRELRTFKGKLEKFKDIIKASYTGGVIREGGTINKGADTQLSIVRHEATAPVAFMAEAIEMETAIYERCVTVGLSPDRITEDPRRAEAYHRLRKCPEVLSALGRELVECGFGIDLEMMRNEVETIQEEVLARVPPNTKLPAARLVFNRSVIIHALRTLKRVMQRTFGDAFNGDIDRLLNYKASHSTQDDLVESLQGMAEISKVMAEVASLTHDRDTPYELVVDRDYVMGDGWVELRIQRAYDQYRRKCVTHNMTPLFDTQGAFIVALTNYGCVVDRVCSNSALRADNLGDRIMRFDTGRLQREGVAAFRQ